MQAVIMAGGKGTRLRAITNDDIPKPMAPIAGKPILQWQVENLRENGITDIIMVIGHLGEKIETFFGNGSNFGVNITYYREVQPLGTAGAFYDLQNQIRDNYFLLVFGDVIFDIHISRMEQYHITKAALGTLFVHPNSHPYDSDLVVTDEDDKIIRFDSKNNKRSYWYNNCVNAGFYILNKEVCNLVKPGIKTDLEKDVLMPLVAQKQAIYAYASPEYIKDVGTPERISTASHELENGYVTARNLTKKQKCIFVDRDGTLNQYKGLICHENDFVLESCTVEAIKRINASGYLTIVVTNQPVVARGLCDVADIENIHNKMKTLLGREGALLDDVLFCPHHPDKGYPEENPVYKVSCKCRKPQIGMIETCVEKYNIDITQSWMIGDTTIDIQTGKNAGLSTALVLTGEAGRDGKHPIESDLVCENILEAVKQIL